MSSTKIIHVSLCLHTGIPIEILCFSSPPVLATYLTRRNPPQRVEPNASLRARETIKLCFIHHEIFSVLQYLPPIKFRLIMPVIQGRIKLFGARRQLKNFRPLFQAVFLSGEGDPPPDSQTPRLPVPRQK